MSWKTRVLASVLGVGALLLAPAASGIGRYSDVTGDSGGAPDITGVTVTSETNGQIEFTIGVADLPGSSDVRTVLLLDTDMNPDTGKPESLGAEYFFVVDELDNTYSFARWTGSEWDWDTPYATVEVFSRRSGVSISVNGSEVGNTAGFNFWTRTILGNVADGETDEAPDVGTWNYSLAAAGPEIRGVLIETKPSAGPRAGQPFTVVPAGLRLPSGSESTPVLPQPESYSCRAKLAGKALPSSGKSGCTWKLPKKARGRNLAVLVTVNYQGATASFPFPYRVS